MPQKEVSEINPFLLFLIWTDFSVEHIDFDRIHSWINYDRIHWAVENAAIVCGSDMVAIQKDQNPIIALFPLWLKWFGKSAIGSS